MPIAVCRKAIHGDVSALEPPRTLGEKTTDEHLKTSWQPHAAAASLMKNDLVAHVMITSDDVTPRFVEWAA
jgi:hypothetical protein